MNTEELLAQANRQDMARQRQIEAQRQSINRLLEARDDDVKTKDFISQLQGRIEKDSVVIQELKAQIDAVGNVVSHWDEDARDRIVEVLARG